MNKRPAAKKSRPDNRKTAKNPTHIKVDARSVALFMLGRISQKNRTLDEALDEAFAPGEAAADLDQRDRGFARLLVSAVLRRKGQIDHILEECLSKPLAETPSRLLNILRLGAVQILFLETPPHAAVDSTVSLAGKHASQRGLINAILRRLDREGRQWCKAQKEDGSEHRLNTPDWLWQTWSDTWGEGAAHMIAACHAEEATLDLTPHPEFNAADLARDLPAIKMENGSLRRPAGGRVESLAGYSEGQWWVQDASATAPAGLLLSALKDNPDGMVLDLCAAPGGKTAQLATSSHPVTAVDLSARRLKRLAENLDRLNLQATVITADIRKWQPDGKVAGVLLDAPCSATGTIRRHPDAAWSKSQAEVDRLSAIQRDLIDATLDMLAPGGVLVYCTCSLQPEEGEHQAAGLRQLKNVQHLPVEPEEVPGFTDAITKDGDLRILPGMITSPGTLNDGGDSVNVAGGNDGFFVTRFIKR